MQEFQPNNVVTCCAHQIVQMIEPAVYTKHRVPIELLSIGVKLLYRSVVHMIHIDGSVCEVCDPHH